MNTIQILTQLIMSGNPQATMQTMMRSNPQINAILNQQKQSGMSMEQFVRQLASQNNIDIEPMLNMMKGRGIKI